MNKSIKIFINYVIGPLLFAWLLFSVYQEITAQKNLPAYLNQLYLDIDAYDFLLLLFIVLLMLAQWMFEAVKWQLLLRQHIDLSIAKAMNMIFSGISFSIATPNRIGEFIGRVLHLPKDLRLQATGYTFVGNFAQLIVTCIAGSVGIGLIMDDLVAGNLAQFKSIVFLLAYLTPVLSLLLLFVFFKAGVIFRWVSSVKFLQRWQDKLTQLSVLSSSLLLHVLLWSFLRYSVFLLQYWLMFKAIGLEVDIYQTAIGVSTVLLLLSILPTISLVELGLRWQVSILVFAPFTANVFGLTMGVTLIWLLNMILPAGIGAVLILGKNFSKN